MLRIDCREAKGRSREALRGCGGEKGLDSGCSILKVEPTGLAEVR